ncbi:unnamed protein product [Dicrocoelium dendriticum]|nr:unnamed protein product [Dicrocoelium dendriticum]
MRANRKAFKLRKKERDLERIKTLLAEGVYTNKRFMKQSVANKVATAFENGIKICIDCAFEYCMTVKECNKLSQQVCRAYGANRRHACPVSLHLVNFSPSGVLANICRAKCDGFDKYQLGRHTEPAGKVFGDYKEIIYLSPDAQDPLLSLSEDTVYVIGGMVDEHLMKGRSLKEAEEQKCRAVRLPIHTSDPLLKYGSSHPRGLI